MKFQEFMERSELMQLHQNYHNALSILSPGLKAHGISFNEALIILALFFESGKTVSPSQLASTLLLKKDRISQSLKTLGHKKLILKKLDSRDQRGREISLSASGKKLAGQLIATFESAENYIESQ